MLNLSVELQPKTEQKIKKILDQHSDKEVFFQESIESQVNELKNGIINIEIDLKEFEHRYQLSSCEFYRQFKEGELGDEEDFITWAGIYEMQLENKKKKLLTK
ncbi:MAG: hypothetical protein KAW12_21385 [Candidatus Aminicenantes bacterium]|nr:hypothetical protein [Candidatus Aminicenantes bacterium]